MKRGELSQWTKAFPLGTECAVRFDDEPHRRVMFIASEAFTDVEDIALIKVATKSEMDTETMTVACERLAQRAVEKRRKSMTLKVNMTAEERLEAGDAMSQALKNAEDQKEEIKEVCKRMKAEFDAFAKEAQHQGERIRTGYDMRPVDIEIVLDYDRGTATEIRQDTCEIITQRGLQAEELQRGLGLSPEPVADAKADTNNGEETPEPPMQFPADKPIPPNEEDVKAAITIIKATKRASAAAIGRRTKWGYVKVMAVLDILTEMGVLGPPQGDEPREIIKDVETL